MKDPVFIAVILYLICATLNIILGHSKNDNRGGGGQEFILEEGVGDLRDDVQRSIDSLHLYDKSSEAEFLEKEE